MIPFRGLVVAVGDWYAKTLAVTLPANMRHLAECYVVTTPGDPCAEVARSVPNVHVYETADFFAYGAHFNKGLCVERCFDVMGRHGWVFILDADILLPSALPLSRLIPDGLNGLRRRVVADWSPEGWDPARPWSGYPLHKDGGPIGFAQLFNAECPTLRGRRPWYDVSFAHAGGGDAYFLGLFPGRLRRVLPADCLHLGQVDMNWMGTSPEARRLMAKYVYQNGWRRAMRNFTPEDVARAGELPGRVEVPGYEPTGFELPFEARANARRARGRHA